MRRWSVARAAPIGYDVARDEAPDVFAVTWSGERVRVTHYPSILATLPCCHVDGEIRDSDRQHEHGAHFACLARLEMPCGYR